jgi:hypothetical protein
MKKLFFLSLLLCPLLASAASTVTTERAREVRANNPLAGVSDSAFDINILPQTNMADTVQKGVEASQRQKLQQQQIEMQKLQLEQYKKSRNR